MISIKHGKCRSELLRLCKELSFKSEVLRKVSFNMDAKYKKLKIAPPETYYLFPLFLHVIDLICSESFEEKNIEIFENNGNNVSEAGSATRKGEGKWPIL